MATLTLEHATDAPPGQRQAFLRLILLMAATMVVGTLVGTFSAEKLLFLYKEQLHLSAGGLATLAILVAVPNYLRKGSREQVPLRGGGAEPSWGLGQSPSLPTMRWPH